jgi:hypothetical protein
VTHLTIYRYFRLTKKMAVADEKEAAKQNIDETLNLIYNLGIHVRAKSHFVCYTRYHLMTFVYHLRQ